MIAAPLTRRRPPPPVVLWAIAGAWLLSMAAQAGGRARLLHHNTLIEGGLPLWAALGFFLLAWQVMVAAMMLPSSLPLIALFFRAAASQPVAGRAQAAFVAGYAAVWSAFGAIAFAGDVILHRGVEEWPWLEARPWLIGGAALVLVGAFQFSGLKDRCLKACRHPGAYLLRHYRRGIGAAFSIGTGHGLFCLGCCWALMLVSFTVGVASLPWMAVLTAVMVFEKTGRGGERGVVPIGIGFLVLGALVMAHPDWIPAMFPGG